MISVKTADKILGKKGDFKKYMAKIEANKKPSPVVIRNKSISIQTKWKSEEQKLKNVVGFIEGNDSVLKNECFVFMAHYDHLGIRKRDPTSKMEKRRNKKGLNTETDIYNGADDNGSGVSVLLETARVMSLNRNIFKRSILFLFTSAEEVGLLGSAYYTKNPFFPIEKTMACINLDMVGRVYEPCDSVWKASKKLVKDFDGIFTLSSPFCPELSLVSDSVCFSIGLKPDNSLPTYFPDHK